MADVKSAVVKASNKSHRDGSWANKTEIKEKIVGKMPQDMDSELVKLVRTGSIEKKSGSMLWRPTSGIGGASAKRNSVRENGERTDRTSDGKRGDRTTEDTARAATGGALAAGVGGSAAGAASSSITRMLM